MYVISIPAKDLKKVIAPAVAVVPSKSPMEQQTRLELAVEPGPAKPGEPTPWFIVARATDNDRWVEARAELPAPEDDAYTEERWLLPGDLTGEVVGLLPDVPVRLSATDKQMLVLTDSGRTTLPVYPMDSVPRRGSDMETLLTVGLKGKTLRQSVRLASYEVSAEQDIATPAFNGVLVVAQPDALRFVGGHSTCVAEYTIHAKTRATEELRTVIPVRSIEQASKMFEDDEPVRVHFGLRAVTFTGTRVSFTCLTLLTPFPLYERVLEKIVEMNTTLVRVNRLALLAAMKRTAPFISRTTERVDLSLSPDGELTVSAGGEATPDGEQIVQRAGEAMDSIDAAVTGPVLKDDIHTAVRYSSWAPFLDRAPSDDVLLRMSESPKANLVIEALDLAGATYTMFAAAVFRAPKAKEEKAAKKEKTTTKEEATA